MNLKPRHEFDADKAWTLVAGVWVIVGMIAALLWVIVISIPLHFHFLPVFFEVVALIIFVFGVVFAIGGYYL